MRTSINWFLFYSMAVRRRDRKLWSPGKPTIIISCLLRNTCHRGGYKVFHGGARKPLKGSQTNNNYNQFLALLLPTGNVFCKQYRGKCRTPNISTTVLYSVHPIYPTLYCTLNISTSVLYTQYIQLCTVHPIYPPLYCTFNISTSVLYTQNIYLCTVHPIYAPLYCTSNISTSVL